MPRDSRMAAREAAAIPFPREETTPPETNTYFVIEVYGAGMTDVTVTGGSSQSSERQI